MTREEELFKEFEKNNGYINNAAKGLLLWTLQWADEHPKSMYNSNKIMENYLTGTHSRDEEIEPLKKNSKI